VIQTLQYIKKDTEKVETKNKNKLVKNKWTILIQNF
jgi:hypothetical protein